MQQFSNLIEELRNWLTSISWVNVLLPYSLYILFGSIGLMLLNDILSMLHIHVSFVTNLFSLVGYFGFLFGGICCLVSEDIKWVPYGLWAYAVLAVFPFTYLSIFSVIRALIWAYMGLALMKYTAWNA